MCVCGGGGGGGGGGGCHFDEKNPKKSLFPRLWGENGHNSINIRAIALKLNAFDREQNFVFFITLVKIPTFFSIFWLKKG